jgi:SAM-dependent methyltransferase
MPRLLDRLAIATHDLILDARFDALRAEVAGGATGRVLEIGAGTGLNFRFYPPGVDVTAIEPARALRAEATRRAEGLDGGATVRAVYAKAEALPFDAGSFDTVVVTFVLCSVAETPREHVEAAHRTTARVQHALQPVWEHVFGGCSLVRRTAADVERAGFDVSGLRRVALPLPRIARDGVVGVAVRA